MNKNYSITLIALGAALIVALSPFQIALGSIPITLQTLVIGLIATLYRPKEATLSVLLLYAGKEITFLVREVSIKRVPVLVESL